MALKNQAKIADSQRPLGRYTSMRMSQQSLPTLAHLIICHIIPGRGRVKFFHIKGSEERAQALQDWLAGQTGVQEARASAVTGSFVLGYDTAAWSMESLLAFLDHPLADFQHIYAESGLNI